MEKPILFKGEMIRAILEGRKTQTRRIIKVLPEDNIMAETCVPHQMHYKVYWDSQTITKCPYGKPGDQLWVRETWWKAPRITEKMLIDGADTWPEYEYDASMGEMEKYDFSGWGWRKKPSIHMPRSASRIDLFVNSIRVERVQDITNEDAKAEGIPDCKITNDIECLKCEITEKKFKCLTRMGFKGLWDSINKKRGYGWDVNPWVWVVNFELIKKEAEEHE